MLVNFFLIVTFLLFLISLFIRNRIKLMSAPFIFTFCFKIFSAGTNIFSVKESSVNSILFLIIATIIMLFLFSKFIEEKK